MISNGKVRQTLIKPTIRQKVWNYMRRNRSFMIGEVMAITGANYKNLREMFKVYELTGYVAVIKREKPFSATRLRLIKYTGVKAPSHDKERNILFDYNTEEEIEIKAISAYEKVLNTLNKGMTTKEEIANLTKLSEASLQKVYSELKEQKILTRVVPTRRTSMGHRLFTVDIAKVNIHREKKEFEYAQKIKNRSDTLNKVSDSKIKKHLVSQNLIKLLDAMTETEMSKRGLDEKAGLRLGSAKNYWDRFIERGIVSKIEPIQRDSKRVLFRVYPNKVKELKAELLKGAKL